MSQSASPIFEYVHPEGDERVPVTPMNPRRKRGKHRVEPWPTSAEREWATDRHRFSWELSDEAYDALRSWVMRVEAGNDEAVALAQARAISVVQRNPAGKRDVLYTPDHVLFDISEAIHDEVWDDPYDTDMSREGEERRSELRMKIAEAIIATIFGSDPGHNILLMTQHCYEMQEDEDFDLSAQEERAERRLELGIGNARDRAIQAMGPDYWD